jgi:hypothetical protein
MEKADVLKYHFALWFCGSALLAIFIKVVFL